ncbi:hypothetical protein AB0K12_46325 [Nonomuraea sp. NPDC049419]|uniref:hypothetical protein n=1 Tax=Nonomuraea sp. NPDC049419 TaxID=3155772 RepID=UPI0034460339
MRATTVRVLPLLAALALGAAGCGGAPGGGTTATLTATLTPAATTPEPDSTVTPGPGEVPTSGTPAPAPRTSGASAPARLLIAGRYQPLWPFSGPDEVAAWQRAYQKNGHQPWHLDPAATAIGFSRDYLGFTEIDQAVKTVVDGEHARVHVGLRAEEGPKPMVAAVVHLMRYGSGEHAPWEVVGTDDTTLSLTKPAYGASVTSPLTVGGRITGVDESIRIQVLHPGSDQPLGERCCVSAGGRKSPWSGKLSFTPRDGRTLTVVASTGGHVAEVERFAVTGVTLPL